MTTTKNTTHKNYTNFLTGFTLIETLMVMFIFSLILVALVVSVQIFYQSNALTLEQAFALNNARKSIEVLVRDMREAAYADDGAFPVIAIATSSFTFYSDIDRDDSVERVRYFLNGDLLQKGLTNASGNPPVYDAGNEVVTTISNYVRNFEDDVSVFQYFDSNGLEITNFNNISEVAFVNAIVIVNINPTRLPNEFTLRSSATLRNLKTNL